MDMPIRRDFLLLAAQSGSVETFQLLLDLGLTREQKEEGIYYDPIKNQDQKMIEYLLSKGYKGIWGFSFTNSDSFESAVKNDNVSWIEFIDQKISRGDLSRSNIFETAVKNKALKILEYLVKENFPWRYRGWQELCFYPRESIDHLHACGYFSK